MPALDEVAEDDAPGEEEGDLDVEHHEHQRHRVEADVEADPGLADRRLAALVDRELARLGRALRPEQQPRDQEVRDDEPDRRRRAKTRTLARSKYTVPLGGAAPRAVPDARGR